MGLTWMKVGFLLKMSRLVPRVLSMSQSGFLALKLDGCGLRIHQAIKRIRRGE